MDLQGTENKIIAVLIAGVNFLCNRVMMTFRNFSIRKFTRKLTLAAKLLINYAAEFPRGRVVLLVLGSVFALTCRQEDP